MKYIRKSTSILFLSLINGLLCSGFILLIDYFTGFNSYKLVLIATFSICFAVSYFLIYVFYYNAVAKRINALGEKIRFRLQSSEVPKRHSYFGSPDNIGLLEEKVDDLISRREKELIHFENLDSYRKEYLGNVSHELKTPVFNIQGYIDTLLNGGLEDASINYDYLRRAEKSIDRLISIIDDLETITQLETGRLELDIETFDIAALCKEVYASLEIIASKRNITLALSKKYDKPLFIKADKYRIRQVLNNLVTNSIKYGREHGKTLISLTPKNNEVIIEVDDNGEGINEEHLARVFERFYRIDKGRSREQGGTGLGLAIVKHIVEAHQRAIKVESNVGIGTTFTFSLPGAVQ